MRAGALAAALGPIVALALASPPASAAQTESAPVVAGIDKQAAERIASGDPKAVEQRRLHPDLDPIAERADDGDWEVGFYADDREVALVIVDSVTGVIEESWTGDQVAWKMARGYDGAFGRTLNAPRVWLPLCAVFVLGLLDWRRLRRPAHLDLVVVVAGFGISHFAFNRGDIGVSVPLAYPPLLYLLGRTLWIAFRGGDGLRPTIPAAYLAVAALFLLGFRAGLNVADSNVIDVGYSGVIGADLIADGEPVYDNFPADNVSGDTYAPVAYYAYVPFEQLLPWSGRWDALPAAHAASIFFDLMTAVGLFWLGVRVRGRRLGAILAFGWAACPYSAYALESNTNDALVSALLVGVMLVLSSPPARGVLLALATATKFAPIALVPMLATYRAPRGRGGPDRRSARARLRPPVGVGGTAAVFGLAFAVTIAIVITQALLDPGLATFWERTIGHQAERGSPFSIWGQVPDLERLRIAVEVGVVALALVATFMPRRRDVRTVAALGAAILIGTQLTVEHWFYLYIPWFLPLVLVAIALGGAPAVPERPAVRPGRASSAARSSRPAPAG